MNFKIFFILSILSVTAFAGVRVGNGGDAIVCYADKTLTMRTSIEMFDYWEYEKIGSPYGAIQLGTNHLTVQKKIDIVIQRIMKFDPALAQEISTIALSMANNITAFLVTQNSIPEIEDANPKAVPENPNCFMTQFAIQWQNTEDGLRRFYISQDLYTDVLTSNNSRAGLILHEAFYRYAIMNGATNSDGIRFFNYVAATDYFEKSTLEDYVRILNASSMNYRGCQRLQSPVAPDVYIDQEKLSCYNNILHLSSSLQAEYEDRQFFYESSTETLHLVNKSLILTVNRDGIFYPLQNKLEKFELRRNILTLDFNPDHDPDKTIDILDFKFNNKSLEQIICINKMSYDLLLNSVVECEIRPHFIQLATGNSFSAWRRILYDGKTITFNFQFPAFIEMNVASRTKILIDPSFPAVFSTQGLLLKAQSVNELTYLKDGFQGRTTEFKLIDNQLLFNLFEKIEPRYLGLRIIATHSHNESSEICKAKSSSFVDGYYSLVRVYIAAPEKVYDLDQEKITSLSDTYAHVLEKLTCRGRFWVHRDNL